jgi:hypothetical protein
MASKRHARQRTCEAKRGHDDADDADATPDGSASATRSGKSGSPIVVSSAANGT